MGTDEIFDGFKRTPGLLNSTIENTNNKIAILREGLNKANALIQMKQAKIKETELKFINHLIHCSNAHCLALFKIKDWF